MKEGVKGIVVVKARREGRKEGTLDEGMKKEEMKEGRKEGDLEGGRKEGREGE